MHTPVPVGFDKDTKITIGIPAYNMRARGRIEKFQVATELRVRNLRSVTNQLR